MEVGSSSGIAAESVESESGSRVLQGAVDRLVDRVARLGPTTGAVSAAVAATRRADERQAHQCRADRAQFSPLLHCSPEASRLAGPVSGRRSGTDPTDSRWLLSHHVLGAIQAVRWRRASSTARPSSPGAFPVDVGRGSATRRYSSGSTSCWTTAPVAASKCHQRRCRAAAVGADLVELLEVRADGVERARAAAGRRHAGPGPAPRRRRRCARAPRRLAGWPSRRTRRSPPRSAAANSVGVTGRGRAGVPTRRATRSRPPARSRPATRSARRARRCGASPARSG